MPKVVQGFQIKARILYNKRTRKDYYEIALSAPQIAKSALPGQFVNIKVTDGLEPLLRRPLSIHRVSYKSQIPRQRSKEKKYIVILYEAVGKGTEILSQKKAGEYLDVIGPLGKGFDFQTPCPKPRTLILVSGGMGSAPLVFLAEKLAYRKDKRELRLSAKVLIGAKTKDDILCEKEFKELGCEIKIATDDGSRGFKGKVTELLKSILPLTISNKPLVIYACGPSPMLKEISSISKGQGIPAQVSLEAHMACGIGACMGCVVKVTGLRSQVTGQFEYKRVCKEGPVFEANEIVWEDDTQNDTKY
jgi:dihydroorotate dehydrogenase electron transfer subunit